MKQRKTGYYVWQFGLRYWHRTLEGAQKRASEFWARDFAQIIDVETSEMIEGREQ